MHSKPLLKTFLWALAGIFVILSHHSTARSEQDPPAIKAIGIVQTQPADHPLALLKRGILDGWVRVSLAIDEKGKLMDALILGYSHPEFSETTLKALQEWKFSPAEIDGNPVSSVTQLNFTYNRDSDGVIVLPATLMEFIDKKSTITQPEENLLVQLDKLDAIPVPIHIISPAYSAQNAREHIGEKVVVRFYIDEKGHVRQPTLKYSDSPETARQAIAAVSQWKFQPPTYQGKPVITRASQEFQF